MARIAIVETYPYEAVWGGDAVYLDRMRQFLVQGGHEITTFVTDIARGRSDPRLQLHSRARDRNHRWRVRQAVPTGEQRFLSYAPQLWRNLALRAAGRPPERHGQPSLREGGWLVRQLHAQQPALVILAFGATLFTSRVMNAGFTVAASKGFFSDRRLVLGEPVPPPVAGQAVIDEVADAALVLFNNLTDLDLYRRASGRHNGGLVTMGFAPRNIMAASDAPDLLYVAAETRPNIASLRWFLDGAWPAVRAQVPSARLRVVGTVRRGFEGETLPGVDFLGYADSLDAEYGRAALVIAPFTHGSTGVKTKIAEALSYSRPVVTTSIGVDPADPGQFGEAVAVADTAGAFGEAVIALLGNRGLRTAASEAALAQYERHYAPAAAYAPLIRLLQAIAP